MKCNWWIEAILHEIMWMKKQSCKKKEKEKKRCEDLTSTGKREKEKGKREEDVAIKHNSI